ncbi:MAG TPA: 4-hydroxybenzoate 3-monooxygenase [Stellaceae bacterium]|nr:4-hydroxybenzoate 3-monooxygenase [Stellaceae bacterium]
MRTQIAIIGAGPAGLVLAHLLHQEGIASVVLENRSRQYIEQRLRAGLLEQESADLLISTGVGERLLRERMLHKGLYIKFNAELHRIDFDDLVRKSVMIYAQQEIVKDLVAARLGYQEPIFFEVDDVVLEGLEDNPKVSFTHEGQRQILECDFVAGCDGFYGVSRRSIPKDKITLFERDYPFAWLGILAEAPPTEDELVYTHHERGFALLTMRSPKLSRLYFQCHRNDDIKNWPDDRIWEEFRLRTAGDGRKLSEGPILQRGITDMRSFVAEPMQYGKLFLAGDAAHIVPPTGGKGMNLAIADVRVLSRAMTGFYKAGRSDLLEAYSRICLRRIWKVQRFSWWVTQLLHRFDDDNAFDLRRQLAEIDYVTSSRAGSMTWAENYVGLPMEWD